MAERWSSITETATGQTVALEQASGFDSDTAEGGTGAGLTLEWTLIEAPEGTDPGLGVDSGRVQQAIFSLPTLTPTRQLNDIEGALSDFGLQPPTYVIDFQTDFGQTFTINVGSQTPTGGGYYVQVPGSNTISIVNSTSIQPVVGFIENPPLVRPAEEGEATPEG